MSPQRDEERYFRVQWIIIDKLIDKKRFEVSNKFKVSEISHILSVPKLLLK